MLICILSLTMLRALLLQLNITALSYHKLNSVFKGGEYLDLKEEDVTGGGRKLLNEVLS